MGVCWLILECQAHGEPLTPVPQPCVLGSYSPAPLEHLPQARPCHTPGLDCCGGFLALPICCSGFLALFSSPHLTRGHTCQPLFWKRLWLPTALKGLHRHSHLGLSLDTLSSTSTPRAVFCPSTFDGSTSVQSYSYLDAPQVSVLTLHCHSASSSLDVLLVW